MCGNGSSPFDLGILEAAAELPHRRLNPAIAMLLPMTVPGLISNERQADDPAAGFRVKERARFQLRQFVVENEKRSPSEASI